MVGSDWLSAFYSKCDCECQTQCGRVFRFAFAVSQLSDAGSTGGRFLGRRRMRRQSTQRQRSTEPRIARTIR